MARRVAAAESFFRKRKTYRIQELRPWPLVGPPLLPGFALNAVKIKIARANSGQLLLTKSVDPGRGGLGEKPVIRPARANFY